MKMFTENDNTKTAYVHRLLLGLFFFSSSCCSSYFDDQCLLLFLILLVFPSCRTIFLAGGCGNDQPLLGYWWNLRNRFCWSKAPTGRGNFSLERGPRFHERQHWASFRGGGEAISCDRWRSFSCAWVYYRFFWSPRTHRSHKDLHYENYLLQLFFHKGA